MYCKNALLTLIAVTAGCLSVLTESHAGENLLKNSNFSRQNQAWKVQMDNALSKEGAEIYYKEKKIVFVIPERKNNKEWYAQLAQLAEFNKDTVYRMLIDAESSSSGTIVLSCKTTGKPVKNLGLWKPFKLNKGRHKYTIYFKLKELEENGTKGQLSLYLGKCVGKIVFFNITLAESEKK